MTDFSYYNPVRIHCGKNAMFALPAELERFGKRVLLVYGGGSIRKTGLYDRILSILREAGKTVFELSGVMPNPRTEKVYEGIQICKTEQIDLLLAVGGGSVIDCAKAIALGARTDRDFWQTFFKDWEAAEDAVPLGVVLTIPATGSECNCSSVITNVETHEKNSYDSALAFPQFTISDPTLTYTLGKRQMVNGIVDTISHIYELYISPPDGLWLTDALAEAALRTEIQAARTAIHEPENYEARANLMWISSFALCGMLRNGKETDWASHCIEHPISALFDVAHGAGLAVVHPAYLDHICLSALPRLRRLAVEVWGVCPDEKSDVEIARAGILCTREFFRELGAPETLSQLGVPESAIAQVADLTDLSCFGYQKLAREDVIAILRSAL